MDKKTFDKRDHKEYNRVTPVRPYDPKTYRKYRANRPRKINYCQLKGCGRELPRFSIVPHRRFCCSEHAELYQKAYRKQWRAKNHDKVVAAKERYEIKLKRLRRERKNKITTPQSNETRKDKTYLI